MAMPRLHLFEFADLTWFPDFLSRYETDYLRLLERRLGFSAAVAPLLRSVLESSGRRRVVDLGSGSGGPIPALIGELAAAGMKIHATLSDRRPDRAVFERIQRETAGAVDYILEPTDATGPIAAAGLRTVFNAFHHFRPSDAVGVLRSAVQAGEPIAVFELVRRSAGMAALLAAALPLSVLVATPWIRPFSWARLFWTYLVPLVPLMIGWNGFASHLRAYEVDELEALGRQAEPRAYRWRAGRVRPSGARAAVTYLIGEPVSSGGG